MNRRKAQKQSGTRHGEQFWEEEKSNVGYKLMQSMGWQTGKGLGKEEQGSTQYIRTKKKVDNQGIGKGANRNDENWAATQGLYGDLLARLNNQAVLGTCLLLD
eukprot:GHVR01073169.1.p1 GENE.GHVR01073169.1~~GHVR01073169.1.p1  ORF type:complete len:103 (+),score=22.17 GHVR01073169.1:38-346(+)